ncbi:hypothetical protein [Bacillus sp. MZGC1]|uniref:hypothetical protein n=1 Tax=Bacillus sp. MZGC1 TaxID=2108543 RepID=UPI000D037E81|nr:hypothetical protein [Bacillus sp. MZGC1]PRS47548.1 hypothetical protein C6Y06_18545 [Bacillus sp. MZGC1]
MTDKIIEVIRLSKEEGRRLEETEKRMLLERVEKDHLRRNALSLIFGELRDGGITARERRIYKIAKEALK